MNRNYLKYLAFGILFVGVQEFWVSVIWRGEIMGFVLAVLITEVAFFSFTYFCGMLLERFFGHTRFLEPVAYLIFGLSALIIIEWYFMGNLPGGEASQFVMFSTWGGAAVMARIFTDEGVGLQRLRKIILATYLPFAVLFTVLGLILPSQELRFAVTYLAAVNGYVALNIFYLIFFWKKYKAI